VDAQGSDRERSAGYSRSYRSRSASPETFEPELTVVYTPNLELETMSCRSV
jgi:hypothetical protein